jgi:RNA polymerase sigma-70 factor (ECF subfamily)
MLDHDQLFAAHYHRLFRYFCRAAGSAETARDLTQDVFVRISRGRVPSMPDHDMKAWLFRIARNLVLDHHRHARRHPAPAALAAEPSRAASQHTDLAVNEALASLAELDRDVFLMRELAGLGYEEIAAACDLTADAVRNRIHRARLSLREHLATPIATLRTSAARHPGRTPEKSEP